MADVTGDHAPVKVADFSSMEAGNGETVSYAYPVASLPEGTGALINVSGAENASVWRVSPASPPVQIAEGSWETSWVSPIYGDGVAGIIRSGSESGVYIRACLVGPNGTIQLGEPLPAGASLWSIAAHSADLLIITGYDLSEKKTEIFVYRMIGEGVIE